MTDLTKVFIFGVILPTIVTVILFVIFLVFWFKCDFRERFLKRCFGKKFATSQKSTSVTYIKDASLHGSRPGSRTDRSASGRSSPCCHAAHTPARVNLSNPGFEHEDSLPKPVDGHISKRYPPLWGPYSPYNKKQEDVCPIPSTGVIGRTEVMLGSAMDPHVPPNSDSGTYSMADSQNNGADRSPRPRDHTAPWQTVQHHTPDNTQRSRDAHEPRTPRVHAHSDLQQIQHEYRFPQTARSCSRDVTHNTSQPSTSTMDNSSSSYSSSDNDIYDSDYGHFLPTSKVKDSGHTVSDGRLRYTPGYAHQTHSTHPANSSPVILNKAHANQENSQHQMACSDITNSHLTSSSRSMRYDPRGYSRNPNSPKATHSASLSPDSIQLDIKDYLLRDCGYQSNSQAMDTTQCTPSKCVDIGGVHFIHNSAANLEAHI